MRDGLSEHEVASAMAKIIGAVASSATRHPYGHLLFSKEPF